MRWLGLGRGMHDGRLSETEGLVRRYAAGQDGMTDRQRERLRAATLAAFMTQRASGSERRPTHRLPRAVALALATMALLALGGTVAAAESGPGQPFYGLRLTIESLTVPPEGSARTQALLAHLERRLDEASREAERGNGPGVADAVGAYLATLDEVSAGIGSGVSQTAIEAGLERHVSVLQRVLGSAPADVRAEVQRAIQQAEQAQQAPGGGENGPGQPARPPQPSHPGPPLAPPGRP